MFVLPFSHLAVLRPSRMSEVYIVRHSASSAELEALPQGMTQTIICKNATPSGLGEQAPLTADLRLDHNTTTCTFPTAKAQVAVRVDLALKIAPCRN